METFKKAFGSIFFVIPLALFTVESANSGPACTVQVIHPCGGVVGTTWTTCPPCPDSDMCFLYGTGDDPACPF